MRTPRRRPSPPPKEEGPLATSFVARVGHGFWCSDSLLEPWLLALALTLEAEGGEPWQEALAPIAGLFALLLRGAVPWTAASADAVPSAWYHDGVRP